VEEQYLFRFIDPYTMLVPARLSCPQGRHGFTEINETMIPAKELILFDP
jgi:hypothetical protein